MSNKTVETMWYIPVLLGIVITGLFIWSFTLDNIKPQVRGFSYLCIPAAIIAFIMAVIQYKDSLNRG